MKKIGDIKKDKKYKYDLFPETAKEALDKWDKGESVFTIEMGGLGPSYEQCIHIVVFEIIRKVLFNGQDMLKAAIKNQKINDYFDEIVGRSDTCKKLRLSGTQVGAAKNLAFKYITEGYRKTLKRPEIKDRHIQVSKNFP